MSDRDHARLIVFAKAPALGRGKSRLADGLGRVEALRINRALHAKTLAAARDQRWRTVLSVSPDRAVRGFDPRCWRAVVDRVAQGRGDLGARLARCVDACAIAAPRAVIAIIGTDCPSLTRVHVAQSLQRAQRDGVHIIPATDGGFVLIAARRAHLLKRAFFSVQWSSPRTLADVCENLQAAGQRFSLATALADIDTPADWLAAARMRLSCGVYIAGKPEARLAISNGIC